MKRLVALSDIHLGSDKAVMPEEYQLQDGNQIVKASPVQKELLKAWEDMCDAWKKPDYLILNGDIIDGKSKRDYGSNLWTNSFYDQIGAAVELIKMLKPRKVYVIRGTGYHVDIEGEPAEEMLGRILKAEKTKGCYSSDKRYLTKEGLTIQVSHAIGSTKSIMYRATAITREIAMVKLNASHEYDADIIIRGHVHYAWASGSPSHMGFLIPCWQLQTPFMNKMSASGTIPDIGGLRLELNKGNFDFEWKTYKLQESKPELEVM